MNSDKFTPTYYLLSKKKIETVPKSLESHKDSIYFLGETKKDRNNFVSDCVDDFRNIYFYLEIKILFMILNFWIIKRKKIMNILLIQVQLNL